METINYKKHGITARKYEGDDKYSWAVFLNGKPKMTGLSQGEVPYYKKRVYELFVKGEQL